MDAGAVEEAFARQRHEVVDRQRRIAHGQLDLDRPLVGLDEGVRRKRRVDHRLPRRIVDRAGWRWPAGSRLARTRSRSPAAQQRRATRTRTAHSRSRSASCRSGRAAAGLELVERRQDRARGPRRCCRRATRCRPRPARGTASAPSIRPAPRAALARTTKSSALSCCDSGRGRRRAACAADDRLQHGGNDALIADRRASRSGGCRSARAGIVPSAVASATRTVQSRSGSIADSAGMNVSGSTRASARIAAARTGGAGSDNRSMQQIHRLGGGQRRERRQRFLAAARDRPSDRRARSAALAATRSRPSPRAPRTA